MRTVLLILALCLMLLLWQFGGGISLVGVSQLESGDAPLPNIVCYAGEKVVRCPSECAVAANGSAQCDCQDFYTRRGEEPLQYSHSLCR